MIADQSNLFDGKQDVNRDPEACSPVGCWSETLL